MLAICRLIAKNVNISRLWLTFRCPSTLPATIFESMLTIGCKDVFACLNECKVTFIKLAYSNIFLNYVIKMLGLYDIKVSLYFFNCIIP